MPKIKGVRYHLVHLLVEQTMAIMFPDRLSDCENASEGERLVYAFLRETARPDREFICWA